MFFVAAFSLALAACDNGTPPRRAVRDASQIEPPSVRYQVDRTRQRVWFLTHEGVFVHDVSRPERVAVTLPDWVWAGAPYGCLPDLALGPKGEAVITSNVLPTLWRIDPDTFAVSVHPLSLDADADKDVGFSGLVYSPQHAAFLAASSAHGSLWRIDPLLRQARKIPLSAPIPEACGLAVQVRRPQPPLGGLADLCVHTPQGGFAVRFGPAWRSAYVSATPCGGRSWWLGALGPAGG
jgi:hypothetical protein